MEDKEILSIYRYKGEMKFDISILSLSTSVHLFQQI